jgi:hypothetical protein
MSEVITIEGPRRVGRRDKSEDSVERSGSCRWLKRLNSGKRRGEMIRGLKYVGKETGYTTIKFEYLVIFVGFDAWLVPDANPIKSKNPGSSSPCSSLTTSHPSRSFLPPPPRSTATPYPSTLRVLPVAPSPPLKYTFGTLRAFLNMSQPNVEKEAGPPAQTSTPIEEAPVKEKKVREYKEFGHEETKATRMCSRLTSACPCPGLTSGARCQCGHVTGTIFSHFSPK